MNTGLDTREVPVVGSEAFKEAIAEHEELLGPKPPAPAEGEPSTEGIQPENILTVDGQGNIIGDTSGIDPAMLKQLQSPESQAQIRALWRARKYGSAGNEKRPLRFITDGPAAIDAKGGVHPGAFQRRDLTNTQLVRGRFGRRLERQRKRKVQKLINKEMQRHGRQPNQSAAGAGDPGIEHDPGSSAAAC